MKKKVLFVAALFIGATAFAQDGLTSKKGEAYLPEAGDWALGFDGTPFLDYVGNMFNGNTGNSVNATWVGNTPQWTIVGKMYKDETTAYRMKVRIGFGSTSATQFNDTSNTTLTGEVSDEMSTSYFNLTLGGGIEKRRGNTRIQGFYGGELLFSLGSSSESYTYGDIGSGSSTATTPNLHTPSYYDFDAGSFVNSSSVGGTANERVTDRSNGSTMQVTLRGFVGVEWFLAPKVSVSAEYGWGLMMQSTGDGEEDTEEYVIASPGGTTESNILRKHNSGGNGSFGIDTDNNGGVITIYFHF